MNKGINTDKTIKKSTKEIFEEFYKKPFEEITKEDIGDGVEMDWGPDVGGEIITDDYDPNDPFYSESNIKHIEIRDYEQAFLIVFVTHLKRVLQADRCYHLITRHKYSFYRRMRVRNRRYRLISYDLSNLRNVDSV